MHFLYIIFKMIKVLAHIFVVPTPRMTLFKILILKQVYIQAFAYPWLKYINFISVKISGIRTFFYT